MVSGNLPSSILIIGSGGREHALVKACLASPARPRILAAPGNGGMAGEVPCFPVGADDLPGLVALARREQVGFAIVGPEVPLALGLVDALAAAGIPAYGPKHDGARLEASKIFTKELLLRHHIPTAPAAFFSSTAPALAYLQKRRAPIVIKADGLAAGKGVIVAQTIAEAEAAVRDMLEAGVFGQSGRRVLVEDCLYGEETSIHLVVSGRDFVVLPTSQDHKRVGDDDTGPNTGGMGAYAPADVVSPALLDQIVRTIARPSVEAIAEEGIDFRGTLYIGLMLTADGPKVLEFNTRFGDPETQVILPRLATDPLALMWAATRGELRGLKLEVRPDPVICVVVAARGYPDHYAKGEPVGLPASLPTDTWVVHAGTTQDAQGRVVSNGGRVLGVCARAATLRGAADKAYAVCDRVDFASKYFRRDIGARQLNRGK
ncbi:MAG TPA: phosphoribosylamine--glycine ligase [Opitutaceae bacterium]|nr:phosphoribosylamine--glycine ligase [Opitutaceae bacterium]